MSTTKTKSKRPETLPITVYKLTDSQNRSGLGHKVTRWGRGVTHTISVQNQPFMDGEALLCSPQVLHAYHHPIQAAIFNSSHVAYDKLKLWEARTDRIVATDYDKIGVVQLKTVKTTKMPADQQVKRFGAAVNYNCALWLSDNKRNLANFLGRLPDDIDIQAVADTLRESQGIINNNSKGWIYTRLALDPAGRNSIRQLFNHVFIIAEHERDTNAYYPAIQKLMEWAMGKSKVIPVIIPGLKKKSKPKRKVKPKTKKAATSGKRK